MVLTRVEREREREREGFQLLGKLRGWSGLGCGYCYVMIPLNCLMIPPFPGGITEALIYRLWNIQTYTQPRAPVIRRIDIGNSR